MGVSQVVAKRVQELQLRPDLRAGPIAGPVDPKSEMVTSFVDDLEDRVADQPDRPQIRDCKLVVRERRAREREWLRAVAGPSD